MFAAAPPPAASRRAPCFSSSSRTTRAWPRLCGNPLQWAELFAAARVETSDWLCELPFNWVEHKALIQLREKEYEFAIVQTCHCPYRVVGCCGRAVQRTYAGSGCVPGQWP